MLEPAWQRAEERLGASHPVAVQTRLMLARAAAAQRRLDGAEEHARAALRDAERALGPQAPEVADALSLLGRVELARRRPADARPLLARAARIVEAGSGADSGETARAWAQVAEADLLANDLRSARTLLQRAAQTLERDPENAPALVTAAQRLARIHYLLGDLPEAHRRNRQALALAHSILGPAHPRVAEISVQLAEVELAAGRRDRALALAEDAASIAEADASDPTRVAMAVASPLGSLERKLGRPLRAERFLAQGLAAAERSEGRSSVAVAARLNDLAYVYALGNRLEEADALLARALAILRSETGSDGIPYALALDTLGVLRARQGRHAEAQAHLETAFSIVGPAFGPDSPVLLEILEHFAASLQGPGGAPERAAQVEARIAILKRRREERLESAARLEAAWAKGAQPGALFQSPGYAYSVDLSGTPWQSWPGAGWKLSHAEFGATRDGGALAVVPVSLLDTKPDPRFALPALLALIDTELSETARPVEVGGHRGVEIATRRIVDGVEYRYRARALVGPRAGYAILAWTLRPPGPDVDEILGVVERVRIHPDRAVVGADAFSSRERTRHGAAFNEIGLRLAQGGRYAEAIPFLERATAIDADDPVLVENLVRVQIASGRFGAALDVLRESVDRFGDHPHLRAYRAYASAQTGDLQSAIADYARAFELGLDDEALLRSYVEALWRDGRRAEALALLDARIETTRSRNLRLLRAMLRRRSGEPEASARAIEELEELAAGAPGDAEVHTELVTAYFEAGRHREAVEACDRALEAVGPSADLYAWRARSQLALGWYLEAQDSVDRALALAPESEALAAFRARVAALLGHGESPLLREPIEPVHIPAGLLENLPVPDEAEIAAGGSYHPFWIEAIHFERGRTLRRTTHFRTVIRDARGADRFASLEFPFHPLAERIYVNELTVRDASGRIVASGQPDAYYVLDPPEGVRATSVKVLHAPVPGLAVGHELEVRVSRRELHPPERFPYSRHVLSRGVATGRSALVLRGDVAEVAPRGGDELEWAWHRDLRVWAASRPPRAQWEPLQPPGLAHLPAIRLADAGGRWEDVAREYLAQLGPNLAPAPEATALADSAIRETAGAPPERRIQALLARARDALSYRAIAFGRRARMPLPVGESLALRYGDCKDHALLLMLMLRHAGTPAHLALVSRGASIDPELPSLDQFDHMLVYCAPCGGGGFLDPTDKDFAGEDGVPRGLAGVQALVLDEAKPRLVRVPDASSERHRLRIERAVEVGADGDAEVEERIALGGTAGAGLRGALRRLGPDERREAFQRQLSGRIPGARLRHFELEQLEDPAMPLGIELRYEVRALFAGSGARRVGRVPASWERTFLEVPAGPERLGPFHLPEGLHIESETHVRAAPGYAVREPAPQAAATASPRFLHWQATDTSEAAGLRRRFEGRRTAGRFGAGDYSALSRETAAALRFLDTAIEIEGPARVPDASR